MATDLTPQEMLYLLATEQVTEDDIANLDLSEEYYELMELTMMDMVAAHRAGGDERVHWQASGMVH